MALKLTIGISLGFESATETATLLLGRAKSQENVDCIINNK